MKLSVRDKVRMTFVLRDMPHYCDKEKNQIGATLPGGELLFEIGPDQVECRFIYKRKLSPEKREAVLTYLNYKKSPEWEGEFEMDEEGTVSYRICTDMSETKDVEFGRLAFMKIAAIKIGEETAETMCRIAEGEVTAEDLCQKDS